MNRFLVSARHAASVAARSSHATSAAAAVRHFHLATGGVRRAGTQDATVRPMTANCRRSFSSSTTGAAAAAAVEHSEGAAAALSASADTLPGVAATVAQLSNVHAPLDKSSIWSSLHVLPETAQSLMMSLHEMMPADVFGLSPWVATIFAASFLVRATVFPFLIIQQRNTVGMTLMRPEMKVIGDRSKAIRDKYAVAGLVMPIEEQMRARAELKALFKKYNCSISRSFVVPLVLTPIFMSMFFALQTLGHVDPTFLEGGMLWFQNLGQLDMAINGMVAQLGPVRFSLGLPLLNSALIALTVKCNTDLTAQTDSRAAEVMKKVMYGFAAISWPFMGSTVPTGVLLYWSMTNLLALVQATFLRSDLGRRIFNIPRVEAPMADLDKSFERLSTMLNKRKAADAAANNAASMEQAVNPFDTPVTSRVAPAQVQTQKSVSDKKKQKKRGQN